MPDDKLQPGDHVEFANFEDPSITMHCVVQNYLEPDDQGFKGGYHVACYYVVPEEEVTLVVDDVVLAQEGIPAEEDSK